MVSQVILPSECFSANITVEGALIRMSPFMDQKVIGLGELTLAVLADETFLWPRGSSWSMEETGIIGGRINRRHSSGDRS